MQRLITKLEGFRLSPMVILVQMSSNQVYETCTRCLVRAKALNMEVWSTTSSYSITVAIVQTNRHNVKREDEVFSLVVYLQWHKIKSGQYFSLRVVQYYREWSVN